jgi:hypothetical protein
MHKIIIGVFLDVFQRLFKIQILTGGAGEPSNAELGGHALHLISHKIVHKYHSFFGEEVSLLYPKWPCTAVSEATVVVPSSVVPHLGQQTNTYVASLF